MNPPGAVSANAPSNALPESATECAESWTSFAAWAADELGVRLVAEPGSYQIEPLHEAPLTRSDATESSIRRGWFRRRVAAPEEVGESEIEIFEAASPTEVVLELVRRLNDRETPVSARPLSQPEAVHEITAGLFKAYELEQGGQAHLAGCHLEDTPLVRLTKIDDAGDTPSVTHRWFDEMGRPMDLDLVERLGAERVGPLGEQTLRADRGWAARMLASAERAAGESADLATIVWAKRVTGRLRFEFGEQSLDSEFAGWARDLKAPPLKCPLTGAETYRLGVLDSGEIAAAEEIGQCEVSGERLLRRDLVTCGVSGKAVAPQLTGRCPVLCSEVLQEEMVTCPRCGEQVARSVLVGKGCRGCEPGEATSRDEQPVAYWLRLMPQLDVYSKWYVSETENRLIGRGTRLVGEAIVVADRETGALIRVKRRRRFGSWENTPLPLDGGDA